MKYADAGVNIAVADDAKHRIRHHASRTFTSGVLGGIGGFVPLFPLDSNKRKKPPLPSLPHTQGRQTTIPTALEPPATPPGRLLHHPINHLSLAPARRP